MPLPVVLAGLASLLGSIGAGAGAGAAGAAGTTAAAGSTGASLLGSAVPAIASTGMSSLGSGGKGAIKSAIAEGANSAMNAGLSSETPDSNLPKFLGTDTSSSSMSPIEQIIQQQIAGGGIKPFAPQMDIGSLAPDMSQFAMAGSRPQGFMPIAQQNPYEQQVPMMHNYLRDLLGR